MGINAKFTKCPVYFNKPWGCHWHQNLSFWAQKSKNFLGRGHSPLPTPRRPQRLRWDSCFSPGKWMRPAGCVKLWKWPSWLERLDSTDVDKHWAELLCQSNMLCGLMIVVLSEVSSAVLLPASVWILCYGTIHHWLLLLWAEHQGLAAGAGLSIDCT